MLQVQGIDGDDHIRLLGALAAAGIRRGDPIALAMSTDIGLGVSAAGERWSLPTRHPAEVIAALEAELRPRWTWWSNETAASLIAAGVRVATCWDVSAVHRLLFGGWRADPARAWAALHDLADASIPRMGQLNLLDAAGDTTGEGSDAESPVRDDSHLRPEWVSGGWALTVERIARWASTADRAAVLQNQRLRKMDHPQRAEMTARAESVAELMCAELSADGLPIDVERAEMIIGSFVGPRPRDETEATELRLRRDDVVRRLPGVGAGTDLRNPAHVRSMLDRVGVAVPDTRAWRLEPLRDANPVVDALLTWRRAERIETTFGYTWLDQHVGADNRLRGAWSGSDGAAGRMTAQAGLHNMPADLRGAVAAEAGHVFVRADLGQIEPRVLAAISGDPLLAMATLDDDMYAPVALRLGVERAVAKVAVLAAMYGQTSGAAGRALRGLEDGYPVAMQYLRTADEAGRSGNDVVTFGGRRIRMWQIGDQTMEAPDEERTAIAARGRFARNAVVQGAAAELFKAWAVTVRARSATTGARIVLCLHDELLMHVPSERSDAAARIIDDCLEEAAWRWSNDGPDADPVARSVRFVAETSVITRWSGAKPEPGNRPGGN